MDQQIQLFDFLISQLRENKCQGFTYTYNILLAIGWYYQKWSFYIIKKSSKEKKKIHSARINAPTFKWKFLKLFGFHSKMKQGFSLSIRFLGSLFLREQKYW